MEKGFVDAHAHIGKDHTRRKLGESYRCKPDLLYDFSLRNNVTDVLVASTPGDIYCPDLGKEDHDDTYGRFGTPESISLEGGKIKFKCHCGKSWVSKNPFKESNDYTFKEVKRLNDMGEVDFHPLPIIHPLKTEVHKDVLDFYNRYNIKGIKIHPLMDKTSPEKYIESELAEILKELDLNVLFHSDVKGPSKPQNIINFAKETGIKCQIAHACHLESESLTDISGLNNVVTDLSPIQLFFKDNWDSLTEKNFDNFPEIFEYMTEKAGIENVLAGTDFFWCGWSESGYERNWNEFKKTDSDMFLYKNAKRFWDI